MQAMLSTVEKWKTLIPWSLSLKLVLSSLAGVLGGAGLLGYLSEYATYSYAIHFGIRPPLEGIPYLRAAVAFGSLFLLLSAALIFAATTFILRSFAWYLGVIPRIALIPVRVLGGITHETERHFGDSLHRLRARPLWQLMIVSLVMALIIVVLMIFTFEHGSPKNAVSDSPALLLFFALFAFAANLAAFRPRLIWSITVVAVVGYLLVCVYFLFTPVKYSEFLRVLGYGGGLTISVELRQSGHPALNENLHLMLRTNDALILYDHPNNRFLEIPNDQVHRIIHASGGMRRLPHVLPKQLSLWGKAGPPEI
jgi:hypothetical protein